MDERIFPMGTDAVNRYGVKVTAQAHAVVHWSSWNGGVPQLIGHDHQRLLGWSWPYALVFQPGRTWSFGQSVFPETPEDREGLKHRLYDHLDRRLETESRPHEAELRRLMPQGGAEAVLFSAEAASLFREGLLRDVRPDLVEAVDKDGLVVVNGLNHLGSGVFEVGGLAVFAHPFFRRSYSRYNTLNGAFFETVDVLMREGVEVRLALDPDLVGLAETYGQRFEFQYWWGPRFTDDLAAIPPGVTQHRSTEREKMFSQIDHTDFFWYSRAGEHTLEVEEVRDSPSPAAEGLYGCRYVHSIVDEGSGEVLHLDGAVRMYDDEGMVERLDTDLKASSRRTQYTKLWRTDHPLPVSLWKRTVNDYYRDNYLVGEYLGGDRAELEGADVITEPQEPADPSEAHVGVDPVMRATTGQELRSLLVPYEMQAGDGVVARLAVRPRREAVGVDRRFQPFLLVPDPEEPERPHALMEVETLHLKKVIERAGGQVGLPEREMWVRYSDAYVNLAPVVHETEDPVLVVDTLRAMEEYLGALHSDHPRTVLTFTVAYPVGDREVLISAAGAVGELLDWLGALDPKVPRSRDELADWAERTAEHQSRAPESGADPLLLDTVSGLFIEREVVSKAFQARTWFDEEAGRLRWSVVIDQRKPAPPGAELLRESLESGAVSVTTSWVLKAATCGLCGGEYTGCGCSVLDDGFSLDVSDVDFFCHTWTHA